MRRFTLKYFSHVLRGFSKFYIQLELGDDHLEIPSTAVTEYLSGSIRIYGSMPNDDG